MSDRSGLSRRYVAPSLIDLHCGRGHNEKGPRETIKTLTFARSLVRPRSFVHLNLAPRV